ncbi:MAG TPA: tol-pal system protein YbgF [Longimicrobium sp.]|nr:tol-pal system protein YbgF [Longimicrobium sp.]
MRGALLPLLVIPLLGGCLATQRDIQDLRAQMQQDRGSQEALLRDVLRRNQALLDSLTDQNVRLRGDVSTRLVAIERQLVQIQELTGQGQQQLTQLRQQIATREEEARRVRAAAAEAARNAPPAAPDSAADAPAGGDDGNAQEMYDAALGALRRGSVNAARAGFEEFLRAAPGHPRAADAQFNIGEAYAGGRNLERAIEAYGRVVDTYPTSPRAPAALLRIGRIEAGRGNRTQARARFSRIIADYPRSPEAAAATRELAASAR